MTATITKLKTMTKEQGGVTVKSLKERIESISRELKYSGPAIPYIKVGVQDARMLVYLAEEHGQLTSENARLRKALEFYADLCRYDYADAMKLAGTSVITRDAGQTAREALRIGEESNAL